MNALYDRARQAVGRALRKYGGVATITRQRSGDYDPVTNSYEADTFDNFDTDVLIAVMKQQNVDGILSLATTAMSRTEMMVGDVIDLKAMSWRVVEVEARAPDGDAIIYRATVQTR